MGSLSNDSPTVVLLIVMSLTGIALSVAGLVRFLFLPKASVRRLLSRRHLYTVLAFLLVCLAVEATCLCAGTNFIQVFRIGFFVVLFVPLLFPQGHEKFGTRAGLALVVLLVLVYYQSVSEDYTSESKLLGVFANMNHRVLCEYARELLCDDDIHSAWSSGSYLDELPPTERFSSRDFEQELSIPKRVNHTWLTNLLRIEKVRYRMRMETVDSERVIVVEGFPTSDLASYETLPWLLSPMTIQRDTDVNALHHTRVSRTAR